MSFPIVLLLLAALVVFAAAYANTDITTGRCRHVCLAAVPSDNVGLLTGLDVKSAQYYTSELVMNSIDDVQWLLEQGILWQAAMKDANARNMTLDDYLLQIDRALESFSSSGKVHDREDFYKFLDLIDNKSGNFLLLLGGKSVGKSLVLRDFQSKLASGNNFFPVLANARSFSGAPLSHGILKSYEEFKTLGSGRLALSEEDALNLIKSVLDIFENKITGSALVSLDKVQEYLKMSPSRLTDDNKKTVSKTFGQIVDFLIKSGEVSEELAVQSLVDLANVQGKRPVLIIDEANRVLGLGEGQKAASATLDHIVKLTKEEKRLDVVMTSSEYAYPYLLEENGLNLNDISSILFAGEIPPKSMWELLVTKKKQGSIQKLVIGMGENLARLLITSYGGHFLRVQESVSLLKREREFMMIDQVLNPIDENITEVLDKFPFKGLVYLRQMAERGFAPVVKTKEPVVEFIVRSNIGGIVMKKTSAKVVGLPSTIWMGGGGDISGGLVPTSESARNLIAIKVTYFEMRLEKERLEKERLEKERLEKERRWTNRIRKLFRSRLLVLWCMRLMCHAFCWSISFSLMTLLLPVKTKGEAGLVLLGACAVVLMTRGIRARRWGER